MHLSEFVDIFIFCHFREEIGWCRGAKKIEKHTICSKICDRNTLYVLKFVTETRDFRLGQMMSRHHIMWRLLAAPFYLIVVVRVSSVVCRLYIPVTLYIGVVTSIISTVTERTMAGRLPDVSFGSIPWCTIRIPTWPRVANYHFQGSPTNLVLVLGIRQYPRDSRV